MRVPGVHLKNGYPVFIDTHTTNFVTRHAHTAHTSAATPFFT